MNSLLKSNVKVICFDWKVHQFNRVTLTVEKQMILSERTIRNGYRLTKRKSFICLNFYTQKRNLFDTEIER